MLNLRYRALLSVAMMVCGAACSMPPPNNDVMEEFPDLDTARNDVGNSETGTDSRRLDAIADDADVIRPDVLGDSGVADDADVIRPADGFLPDGTGTDVVPGGDGGVVFTGPCTAVGVGVKVCNEMRNLPRRVYVRTFGAGFAAGNRAQVSGLDHAFVTRVGVDGVSLGQTNVSEMSGALVGGGAIAPDGTGLVSTFFSNGGGGLEIYARRVRMDGTPVGTSARISNDTLISEEPQIVEAPGGGWVVVWRSINDTTGATSIMSASLSSTFVVGTPVAITPLDGVPGSFTLAGDGTRVAIAYVFSRSGFADAYIAALSATGAVTGTPTQLTTMALISDSIGLAIRGDEGIAVWGERTTAGTLHIRRASLSTGVASPRVGLAMGMDFAKPGITLDGTGYAVAFRAPTMMGGSIGMLRLTSAFATRESASLVYAATAGDAVHIAARGDGTYVAAWSDEIMGRTVCSVQVMRCP